MGYLEPWWEWNTRNAGSEWFKLLIRVFGADSSPLGSLCHQSIDLGLLGSYSRMIRVYHGSNWCHRCRLGIRDCLGHNRRISNGALLTSLFIYPVSKIRLPGFKTTVLIQVISEVRLVTDTPSAAT